MPTGDAVVVAVGTAPASADGHAPAAGVDTTSARESTAIPSTEAKNTASSASSTEPEFLKVEEAALLLRVDRKTVLAAIKHDEIPGVLRVRRSYRIHRPTLIGFVSTSQGSRPPIKRGRR